MICSCFVARTHGDPTSSSLCAQERERLALVTLYLITSSFVPWFMHLCLLYLLRLSSTSSSKNSRRSKDLELVCAGARETRILTLYLWMTPSFVPWLMHMFLLYLLRLSSAASSKNSRRSKELKFASAGAREARIVTLYRWQYSFVWVQTHSCLPSVSYASVFHLFYQEHSATKRARARVCTSVQRGRGFGCGTSHRGISVSWLIHLWYICVMTYSSVIYLWHDSFICDMTHSSVSWLIHLQHAREELEALATAPLIVIYLWHDSFICDMTHSSVTPLIYLWHDSFICGMTRSCVTWLVHVPCAVAPLTVTYVQHDSFKCEMNDSCMTYCDICATWLIHVWHDWFMYDMTQWPWRL